MELYISAVQVSGCARRKQGTSDVTEQRVHSPVQGCSLRALLAASRARLGSPCPSGPAVLTFTYRSVLSPPLLGFFLQEGLTLCMDWA